MKEYQNLIGSIVIAAAIIMGAVLIGNAMIEGSRFSGCPFTAFWQTEKGAVPGETARKSPHRAEHCDGSQRCFVHSGKLICTGSGAVASGI